MNILCSLHDADGFEHVRAGQPAAMTLRMRNRGARAIHVSRRHGAAPRVRVDGREVALGTDEHWWFPNEVLSVELPDFRIDGEPGPHKCTVQLEGLGADADGQHEIVVMVLGAGSASPLSATWTSGAEVAIAKGSSAGRGELTLSVDAPDAGRYYVALSSGNVPQLGALVLPEEAEDIDVSAGDPWVCEQVAASPRAIWSITGSGSSLDVAIRGILSRRKPGFAHVVLYTDDRFTVLPVVLVAASVRIESFSVNKPLLQNINEPATVLLSWDTVNASAVVLSTAGVVFNSQSELPQTIEETTTFVLTAFDSALDQVVSKSVTVTVDPPLATRLVPKGTIALWSGTANDIPPRWHLCDGENGTPDLRNRFVMGAGTTAPGDRGEEQTHTHVIPETVQTWPTSTDGKHRHKLPADWYGRDYSDGPYSSIDTKSKIEKNKVEVQEAGGHEHVVTATIQALNTGPNSGSVRPPWYALCYIMKGA